MRHFRFSAAALTACVLLLDGCALSPNLDSRFGDSVRLSTAQQTLNPNAARSNTAPVNGLDSRAADGAYESYQQSFRTQAPSSNPFTIGVTH
jgi:hypothetical protein